MEAAGMVYSSRWSCWGLSLFEVTAARLVGDAIGGLRGV